MMMAVLIVRKAIYLVIARNSMKVPIFVRGWRYELSPAKRTSTHVDPPKGHLLSFFCWHEGVIATNFSR